MPGWFGQSREPIGIDFGSHSIRMMQLRTAQGDGPFVATAAARHELPADLPAAGEDRAKAIGKIIAQMLSSGPFVGKRVVTSLPSSAIQYKNLRLPRMPADEIKSAVEWEASDRLNLGADKAAVQFFDAGEVRQGDDIRQEVILLAATHKAVDEHMLALSTAGLEPIAVECVPSALARCLSTGTELDPDAAAQVVIDFGYAATKALIVRNGRVVFFKNIEVGAQALDRAVAEKLAIDLADACELRRKDRGVVPQASDVSPAVDTTNATDRDGAIRRAVYDAMRESITELAREIGLCLRYYSVTFRGRRPESALLIGGEAYDLRLPGLLSGEAGVEVATGDPLTRVDCSAVEKVLGESHCEWGVAAGLAMRSEARSAATRKRGAA
ncbi:MAG: hypothetical protein GC164_01825 [Phycisphaera sp.]|nr:hypothetical protein [Phycisphaera sp.]